MRTTALTLLEDYGHRLVRGLAKDAGSEGHILLMDYVFGSKNVWLWGEVSDKLEELDASDLKVRDFVKED